MRGRRGGSLLAFLLLTACTLQPAGPPTPVALVPAAPIVRSNVVLPKVKSSAALGLLAFSTRPPALSSTGIPVAPATVAARVGGVAALPPEPPMLPALVPAVQVHTVYFTDTYRLEANSCAAAGVAMRANGPDGWPAETRLTFQFVTPPVPLPMHRDADGRVCTAAPIDVAGTVLTFTLRISLPEWEALALTGCAGAAHEWQAVHDALVVHEHGHADRYQARYAEWAAKISGRLASANISACGTTAAAATAEAQAQVDALIQGISAQLQSEISDDPEQARYEEETQHGIRQGAVFHTDACRCGP